MLVSLKACKFEHTELSIHFESFNDECAIVSPGYKSVESRIKTNACKLAAELVSFKIDHPCLKRLLFQNLKLTYNHKFSRTHYKLVRL